MDEGVFTEVDLGTAFNDGDSNPSDWTGMKSRQRFPVLDPVGGQTMPSAPPVVLADWEKIKRAKAISATFDLPFGMAYDGEPGFTEELNKKNPNWTAEIGKSVMRSIGGQYTSLGNAMELFGYSKEQADVYRSYGRQLANAYTPTATVHDVTWQRFISPEWWSTVAVEGVTSSLALLPAGIIGAYAGMATGAAVGLGAFGQAMLGGLFGAAVSRPIESAFEAAQTMEEARTKGLPEAEVQRQAEYVFNQNMKLAGLDAAQIALAITPMGRIISKAAPIVLAQRIAASRIARVGLGAAKFSAIGLSEGGEEGFQTGVQQTAAEGGTIFDKIKRFNPEMQDAVAMGAIMGYGLAGAGSVFTSLTDRITSTMKPALKEEYHAQVQAGLTAGMDEHEATVSALDAITKTPEGQAHVEQVAKEMKDLAEGKVKRPATAEEIQTAVDKYIADEQEGRPDIIPQSDVDALVNDESVNAIASGQTSFTGEEPANDATAFGPAFASAKNAGTDSFIDSAWSRIEQGKKQLFTDNPKLVESAIQAASDAGMIKSRDDVAKIVNDFYAPQKGNFLVSEDAYQAALKSLKEKTSGLHAGIDPMVLGDLVKIGAYHIERGVRSFAEWSKVMLERFGDAIKPHLQEVWDNATDMVKRGVKSGIETDVLTEQAKTVENPTMPAKDVKGQIRLSTGQRRIVNTIREDVALSAAMKKAEQASRVAYAAGNKDGIAAAKADMQEIVIKAKVKAESFGFSEGFKLAEKLTNKELTAAYKAKEQERLDTAKTLIKLINESDIPGTMKGKYLEALAGKLTEKRVNDILDRISSMSETATRQEIVDDLNDFKSHLGSIDVDYQKRINELLQDINLKKIGPKTRERLQSLIEFANREGMPSGVSNKMLADIERLQLRQPEDMSVQDLKDLRDMAEHLFEMGKLKRKLWTKYNQRMRERAIADAIKSTHNIDAATADNPGMWNATKGMGITAYLETLSPLRVTDLADGAKNERGWNYIAARQLSAKSMEAQYNTKARTSAVMEEAERLGFKTMDISEENLGRIVANIRVLEGSPKAAETIMERFGWTELDPLTPDEIKLVAAMEKATNERVAEVAALWEERHNVPFVKRDRYILPLYYEGEFSTGIEDVSPSDPYRTVTVPQGFGIERVEGVTKMPRLDLWGMLEQAINEQEWFLEVQPEIDNIKRVVKSKEYVAKAGQSISNWWANHLDIVARKGITTSAAAARRSMPWVNKFLGKARDNMTTAVLGFRASSILIQPLAVFNTLAYVSSEFGPMAAGEVLKEFGKTWVSTSHFNDIVNASHSLQMRAAGEVALAELLHDTQANTRLNKFKRASMALLQKADLRTTAGTQQAIENILNNHGIPNAHLEAETITHLVAASSDVAVRPHVFSRGEVAKTFLTFQTFMVNSFGMLTHDIVKRGLIEGAAKKKIGALIGIGFILAGKAAENEVREFLYELMNRRDKPDDRWPSWIKAIFGLASDIPFFGNVFNIVSAHGGSSEVPIQKMLNDTIRESIGAIGAIAREPKGRGSSQEEKKRQVAQAAFQVGKTAATIGTGTPGVGQGLDIIEGLMFPKKEGRK